MPVEIGDRVFAVQGADERTVELYGFGTYKGEQDAFDQLGEGMKEIFEEAGVTTFFNPMIELDNGSIVFGFQCYWGPEQLFELWRSERQVVEVSLPE